MQRRRILGLLLLLCLSALYGWLSMSGAPPQRPVSEELFWQARDRNDYAECARLAPLLWSLREREFRALAHREQPLHREQLLLADWATYAGKDQRARQLLEGVYYDTRERRICQEAALKLVALERSFHGRDRSRALARRLYDETVARYGCSPELAYCVALEMPRQEMYDLLERELAYCQRARIAPEEIAILARRLTPLNWQNSPGKLSAKEAEFWLSMDALSR